ncbi:MAG: winged helix-turn-helix transcriptional regulator [Verrucomicrobia bacterium]|nr:winged helix-turn-helix transcriptional regulator [Verrucomicrobiota bacterium]
MDKFLSSEFSGPEESPGFLLWQVCMSWQRRQRHALAALDLTHVQFVLLASISWLETHQKHLTQAQLASHAKTDPMMTSQVLRTLEKEGYIKRHAHPTDTRAFSLWTTAKGKRAVEKALVVVEKVDGEFFAPLGKNAKQYTESLRELLKGASS